MNSRLMKVTLLVAILAVTFLVIFPLGLGRTLIWGYNGQGSMMGQGQNQSGMMGQHQGMMGQGQNQSGGGMGQHQGMMGQGQNQSGGGMGQHQGMMGQGQNQSGGGMGQHQGMMGQGQNQSGMMGQRSSFFSPIFLIGGLVRLALLGGLAGLAFIFLRGVWSGFYQPTR